MIKVEKRKYGVFITSDVGGNSLEYNMAMGIWFLVDTLRMVWI